MRGPYIPLFSGWWIFEREFSRAENVEIGHTISSLLLAESVLLLIARCVEVSGSLKKDLSVVEGTDEQKGGS